jgi:hypothetical protein
MNCWKCDYEVEVKERVGFRDRCPRCDSPLHCCFNCKFYDPAYNNQCRETAAERVVDKDRFNFCDYFSPGINRGAQPVADNRAKLDALFKKG